MTLNVVAFTPARPDIPERLRQLADEIEAGEYGSVIAIAAAIQVGGDVHIEEMGDTDNVRSRGLLSQARDIVKARFFWEADE